jgi:hypothetical protein
MIRKEAGGVTLFAGYKGAKAALHAFAGIFAAVFAAIGLGTDGLLPARSR